MLDSFNKNSIQVTVTWELLDNTLGGRSPRDGRVERKSIKNSLPSLYTIVKHYPTVLFTLENNSDFEESSSAGKISSVFCTCQPQRSRS